MELAVRIQDFGDESYDPFDADFDLYAVKEDPCPEIARLRERGAVLNGRYRDLLGLGEVSYYPDGEMFTVLGSKEVSAALTDEGRFSNADYKGFWAKRSARAASPPWIIPNMAAGARSSRRSSCHGM